MNSFSLTQIANYATMVVSIFALFGVSVTEQDVQGTIAVIAGITTIVTGAISYFGRFRKGDLTVAGKRK